MRIVRADVMTVAADFPRPLRFAATPLTVNSAVVAQLHEAGGAVGLGYAPTFGFGTTALRAHIADDFVPRLIGIELADADDGVRTLLRDAWIAGRAAGLARQAIAVLELALCDLEGQIAGVPLHRLWGKPATEVRAYASGGWRFLPIEELTELARSRVDQGFDAIKIQVGLTPEEDAERLGAIREAVGPDVEVMLDANQRMPSEVAAEWAAALAPYRPYWLEEPIRAEKHGQLAHLRTTSPIAIAAGESESESDELEDLLQCEAVDVIQPDVYRAGLTTSLAIMDKAASRDVMVAPHLAHEIGAQLLSGGPDGGWVEYFDWFDDWWEAPLVPHRGRVRPSELPGHGLRFRHGWLEAHAT
jgi:L-alanine-DL-glutamate epimerase-like enolase superfamily enzyme